MIYRIAVCDDDETEAEHIVSVISEWGHRTGYGREVSSYPSAEAFLFDYEENGSYDILLLDVEMPGISGLELARRIRADKNRAEIIFITSHFELVGEGYEVDALHYLVKPVSEEKLREVLFKAAARLAAEPPFVIISCEGETVRLYERDILYAESFLHYISIHTPEREYKIKENISAFEQRLSDDFFRIHRSYLASLKHVAKISKSSVTLEGGAELPLARGKYDAVNRAFIARN